MTVEAACNLSAGQLVRVRTRHWLVEDVLPSTAGSWLRLSCVDDDAQGDSLEIIWETELDGQVLDAEGWAKIGHKGFDDRRHFAAYFNTLRWHCVTATDPKLFQAPFRAGIRIDAYQLEPLKKALLLPRVNLFIADDVGLGKTIEAGLIATELLLRRRVRDVVVACPPSMLKQWQEELDARFGLRFEILDRDYVERIRRERGYAVNPWDTFPRFLVSQRLLIDETYAAPMRVWLDNLRPASLLILDEAHHAAPASGTKYAIDSKITRAIRDLAPRFEHRLFLSATPHNGHSNSFSALLELLDDKRFMRGVPVLKSALDAVMVRRLKEDVRLVAGGFPIRRVVQIDLKDLSPDAPELRLAEWLDDYATVRRERFAAATKREQTQGALILSTLQQRLFSSVEAFQRTLAAHRRAMEKVWAGEIAARAAVLGNDLAQLTAGFDNDDERSQLPSEQQESEAAIAIERATASIVGVPASAKVSREQQLLADMARVAEQHRHRPDARITWLIEWLHTNCCPGIRLPGNPSPQPGAAWSPLRLIIFTEYEDTARYLRTQLEAAIVGTDRAEARLDVFHGPTPLDKREDLKRAFNEPLDRQPLRILIATDAAREGLNLQAHCWHLVHYDLPWNPSRLEQRNGRIDRKLQPNAEVFCHYFVYTQRPEDRVLRALVRKTETIRLELGSLSEVIEKRLRTGIRRAEAETAAAEIEALEDDPEKRAAREAELDDAAQERQTRLRADLETLTNRIDDARRWIGLDAVQLRDALNCSLDFLHTEPLRESPTPLGEPTRYVFPNLEARHGGDPRWAATLDTLRPPAEHDQSLYEWRRETPLRPVVFAPPPGFDGDTVQLHLSHRVVQRLLGRFLAQGFVYQDLSRACLAQSDDAIPRVVLLGRLAVYGAGAARLHEELITVTARWIPPADRTTPLRPYGRDAEARTISILQESLKPASSSRSVPDAAAKRLQASMAQDIGELLPHLEQRGNAAREEAEKQLTERGRAESESLKKILEDQRRRVLAKYKTTEADQLLLGFSDDEKRQLAADRRHWERWLANVDGDLALGERTRAEAGKVEAQIKESRLPEKADEERLLALVSKGDLATAREYLNRLQGGHSLPTLRQVEPMAGFTAQRQKDVLAGFQSANNLEGVVKAARIGGKFSDYTFEQHTPEERKRTTEWLQAWQRVRQAGLPKEADVSLVLGGVGFAIQQCQVRHQQGSSVSEVSIQPSSDRDICPIPQFGSASRGYLQILHMAVAPPELMVDRAQKLHGAGFRCVFYGGALEPDERAKLVRLCREKRVTLLVLDDLLVVHLAHLREQRLSSFFQAIVPYTWVDPFVSTSSLVPPEMFFGRSEALTSLLDTNQQRCFVYGGRQLGKTALLREVERRFHQPANQQFALWFDLLANGFGVEAEPPLIWELLEPKFRAQPGFHQSWQACEKRTRRLEDAIVHWLEADERRRFLLLLDEGDRFLDRDALKDFAESRRLKGLMDRTNRRFKVVFAGLHNVQRTTTHSNHPLAHLGEPINIGAFSENGEWMEAYSLLTVPLTALGYTFESPDLPSRILTLCNFYPGLLQQFGSRLLQRSRTGVGAGPVFTILEQDVDAIARDEEFRKFMVERFKWTLQLDPRYHYLAYTYAYLFHEDAKAAAVGYTAGELRKRVEDYRPREFAPLSQEEFTSLLDEMRGLGIFRKNQQDRYSLRNANVLLLLGDPSTILDELVSDRALPKGDYRSESFHGPLGGSKHEGMRRRVLTRPEESWLAGRNGVTVITGSLMLDVGLVEGSLRGAFPQHDITKVSTSSLPEFRSVLEKTRESQTDGTNIVFVGAHIPWDATWTREAQRRCSRLKSASRFLSIVFLTPTDLFWKPGSSDQAPEDAVRLSIRKWGLDFIEPWLSETNLPVPQDGSQRLMELTGGWPRLLYIFADKLQASGNFGVAVSETKGEMEGLISGPLAFVDFLGDGPVAAQAFERLRQLRSLSPAEVKYLSAAEVDESAELLDIQIADLNELVNKAVVLQLVDRKGPAHYEWDPVFDRLLLRK